MTTELCTCGHDELVHHGEYEPACTFTDDGGRLCPCIEYVTRDCGDHEADTAAAALRRVKALHFEQGGYCAHCSQLVRHEIEHALWPCETALAFSEAMDDRPAAEVWMHSEGWYVAKCGLCDWYDEPYSTEADAGEVARLHVGEEHADV